MLYFLVLCGCSLVVKFKLPKLASRVRFPSPAFELGRPVGRLSYYSKANLIRLVGCVSKLSESGMVRAGSQTLPNGRCQFEHLNEFKVDFQVNQSGTAGLPRLLQFIL